MVSFNPKIHALPGTIEESIRWEKNQTEAGSIVSRQCSLLKTLALTLAVLLVSAFYCGPGLAQDTADIIYSSRSDIFGGKETFLYTSLYTKHYDPDPDHVNDQNMLGFESETGRNRLWGLAIFDNSFGQESQYLYLGQKWRAFESDRWYYKLTGGLLHGYKEPYEDKIPLNDLGVAPAIIPALGYRNKSFFAEFSQLGLAAGMVTAGFVF
jgi:hypothetical protein